MLLLCALVAGSGSVWAVGIYQKVTSAPSDWSGVYLIVYEGDSKHNACALDGGSLTSDSKNNGVEVTIDDSKITGSDAIDAAAFTIAKIGSTSNYSIKAGSGKYIGSTSYSNALGLSDSGIANTIAISGSNAVITSNLAGGDGEKTTMRYNYSSDQLRFRYYKSGQQAVALYKLIKVSATISSVGWTTFSCTYALDFTGYSDANAYMVTSASGTTLTLSQVTGTVPAETPLLISGTENATVKIPVAASSTTNVSANKLKKGTGASVNAADKYVLVARDSKAVFAPTGDHAATVPVGKAYLDLNGVTLAPEFVLDDSETTGIESVNSEVKGFFDGEFYNLSGQRVTKPTKGLYIVNGKKVIIK